LAARCAVRSRCTASQDRGDPLALLICQRKFADDAFDVIGEPFGAHVASEFIEFRMAGR
jgi:hypothetical protein